MIFDSISVLSRSVVVIGVVLVGFLVLLIFMVVLDGFSVVVVDLVDEMGAGDMVDVDGKSAPAEASNSDAGKAERTHASPICFKGVLH